MLLRAFAKINLDLRVTGRLSDGYHEIRTILQTIDWHDEIRIEPAEHFEFTTNQPPKGETNLVVRAVRAFEQACSISADVQINLYKNIPSGAGLGGGSSDASATFLGLLRYFKTSLSPTKAFAALRALGSDVPFFAVGGRAVAVGRGDEVFPLEEDTAYWLVLVEPEIAIPTADAYSWLTVQAESNSIESFCAQFLSRSVGTHEPQNDFEAPIFRRYKQLSQIKQKLLELGAFRAALSGSGSTIYGQFSTEQTAARAAAAFEGKFRLRVTKPLLRLEYFQRMIEG